MERRPLCGEGRRTKADGKLEWEGEIVSVQPRIRLTRSFDQSSQVAVGSSGLGQQGKQRPLELGQRLLAPGVNVTHAAAEEVTDRSFS
jgi:hypothetical protein